MSMHKIPLTLDEREGLQLHGLDIGTPSQLSDVFRQGMAYQIEIWKRTQFPRQSTTTQTLNSNG